MSGWLKDLVLMLAGGGSGAGFLQETSPHHDFIAAAGEYLRTDEEFLRNYGESFTVTDAFGRGPFAGDKAEYFAAIGQDIWRLDLQKQRLGGWKVTQCQRLDQPEEWICNLLERNENQ